MFVPTGFYLTLSFSPLAAVYCRTNSYGNLGAIVPAHTHMPLRFLVGSLAESLNEVSGDLTAGSKLGSKWAGNRGKEGHF